MARALSPKVDACANALSAEEYVLLQISVLIKMAPKREQKHSNAR
jgi:hypothetical protein